MPQINNRYSSTQREKDEIQNLKTGKRNVSKDESSPSSTEERINKPFAVSVKPTGQNYLNYLMVKEQQKLKKNRLNLLKSLDKQRHKFKYYS